MNEDRSFFKNFSMVLVSNVIVLFSTILTGLVVPKLLGVTNYGYYKIFFLYVGYTPLLELGFLDGLLLIFGKKSYEELDKVQFRLFTLFFTLIQAGISALIIAVGFACFEGVYRFICIMLGIDTITLNMTRYYQYISQATMRFKEFSIRKVLLAGLKILLTLSFYVMYRCGYRDLLNCYAYITALVLINIVLLMWYVFSYRDITFGLRDKFGKHRELIKKIFKLGIVLTISYQVANLIFSVDRQFVSLLFDTETYGVYSFAYSLITMVTSVVDTVPMVLFPTLKRKSVDTIIQDFTPGMALVSILVFAALIGYYPLCACINWYLPEYVGAIYYLKIIFPGLALSCCISSIMFTYYKALDDVKRYFKICCSVLIMAILLNGCSYAAFKSAAAISWASIITLLVWYILAEVYFVRTYHVKWIRNLLYILVMMVMFYFSTFVINNPVVGTIVYGVFFVVFTLIMYRKTIIVTKLLHFCYKNKLKLDK